MELEILEEPVVVYNFEVADWRTYYVSEEEVLVHNTCTAGGSNTTRVRHYTRVNLDRDGGKRKYNGRGRKNRQ